MCAGGINWTTAVPTAKCTTHQVVFVVETNEGYQGVSEIFSQPSIFTAIRTACRVSVYMCCDNHIFSASANRDCHLQLHGSTSFMIVTNFIIILHAIEFDVGVCVCRW